jgi:hypothetical protein
VHIEFVESVVPSNILKACMRMETNPVSETLCFLEYRTMDKVQKPIIPSLIEHRQNSLGPQFSSTLEKVTACTSEMLLTFYQATGRHIPDSSNLPERSCLTMILAIVQ